MRRLFAIATALTDIIQERQFAHELAYVETAARTVNTMMILELLCTAWCRFPAYFPVRFLGAERSADCRDEGLYFLGIDLSPFLVTAVPMLRGQFSFSTFR